VVTVVRLFNTVQQQSEAVSHSQMVAMDTATSVSSSGALSQRSSPPLAHGGASVRRDEPESRWGRPRSQQTSCEREVYVAVNEA
jgi:hypothetical protein